jgi:RNA polymerase sigma factor (sigma-70 family)
MPKKRRGRSEHPAHPYDEEELARLGELLALAQSDDDRIASEAFRKIYANTTLSGRLFSFIYRSVGNWHDAEDLFQRVMFAGWRYIHRLSDARGLMAYFFTIAINEVNAFLKSKRPTSDVSSADARTYLQEPDLLTFSDLVERALAQVPLCQRQCLLLDICYGFRHQEIAVMLKRSRSTVDGHVSDGRRRLRQELLQLGFQPRDRNPRRVLEQVSAPIPLRRSQFVPPTLTSGGNHGLA